MKIKIKEIEIECTVEEFKSLYEAGMLDDLFSLEDAGIDQDNWNNLLKKTTEKPNVDPWRDQAIMVYGCGMPKTYTTSDNSTLGLNSNNPTA